MMTNAAWLLMIPAAAAAGFLLGRRGSDIKSGNQVSRLSNTYFRGLNYLLNEQQDKAIEIFLQIAEVDKDTVETQFALGHLFRRRGEMDRAIRMHQSLVTKHGLSEEQKTRAVLALGEDYMRAGLLDRAETLLNDLVEMGVFKPQALRHLISITQAERDWYKAIEYAQKYEEITGESMSKTIAHYYCELADQARSKNEIKEARKLISNAYDADNQSVRAGMIEAQIELSQLDDAAAIRSFERVVRHDHEYLPEVLPQLLTCYERKQETTRAKSFLLEMTEHYAGVSPLLALADIIQKEEGTSAAYGFLSKQLQQRPSVRGKSALIDLSLQDSQVDKQEALRTIKTVTDLLVVHTPGYRCQRCGFSARAHHWQCPSCKNWGTVKPLLTSAS
jgi:lipopolysaccharide assembly protein B